MLKIREGFWFDILFAFFGEITLKLDVKKKDSLFVFDWCFELAG